MQILSIGDLAVECSVTNYIVYKEITVTATRDIQIPIKLPVFGSPPDIKLVVSSKAVVQDGDEFVRNVDMVVDLMTYIMMSSMAILYRHVILPVSIEGIILSSTRYLAVRLAIPQMRWSCSRDTNSGYCCLKFSYFFTVLTRP